MYRIEVSPLAEKFLSRLSKSQKNMCDRIRAAINSLRESPYKGKKLVGELSDFRSLRVGDYRVLYAVIEKRILIQVVKIDHRRDVYR